MKHFDVTLWAARWLINSCTEFNQLKTTEAQDATDSLEHDVELIKTNRNHSVVDDEIFWNEWFEYTSQKILITR